MLLWNQWRAQVNVKHDGSSSQSKVCFQHGKKFAQADRAVDHVKNYTYADIAGIDVVRVDWILLMSPTSLAGLKDHATMVICVRERMPWNNYVVNYTIYINIVDPSMHNNGFTRGFLLSYLTYACDNYILSSYRDSSQNFEIAAIETKSKYRTLFKQNSRTQKSR